MTRWNVLPHQAPRNVAGAIYGLVLGSSIIAAASADHPRQAGLVEVYLCVTAVVFYLAHVYARVIGGWIEGESPSFAAVRQELRQEWPMVSAQLLPAALLLLGAVGLIDGRSAITLALVVALLELLAGVAYACWKARATARQTLASVVVAVAFAVIVIVLKVFVHG